jgi:hypothetical protein
MPTNMNVANEILRQLGGQRFAVSRAPATSLATPPA